MPVCIVEGCGTTSKRKTDDIMLHSFPKDKELIKRWLQQMNQDFGALEEFAEKVFTSTRGNYRMCSLHFSRSAYEIRGLTTFLRRDAIPTLFPEPVAIRLPAKGFASAVLHSELHANMQHPIQKIVVGLCQPSVASQMRIKTEDETSSGSYEASGLNFHNSPVVSHCIQVKTEDETTTRKILINEFHTSKTMAPNNVNAPKKVRVVGFCQHGGALAPEIHIKTEDDTTSRFLTTELHTVPAMPPTNKQQESNVRSQGFIPVVSRKRPYTAKNNKTIGTMTEYLPGKVHKSVQCDKSMGANHKGLQVSLRPFHSSVGIQCNLVNLPSLKTISPRTTEPIRKSEEETRAFPTDLR